MSEEKKYLLPFPFCGSSAMLSAAPKAPQQVSNTPQDDPLSGWLVTEISAIDCEYRGDPSYTHDAYWMREAVIGFIEKHKSVIDVTPPQQQEHTIVAGSIEGRELAERIAASLNSPSHQQEQSGEAARHATALEQCAIFAADVGDNIAKAMTDAAAYLRSISPATATASQEYAPRQEQAGTTQDVSREERMVTLRADESGKPTVWCDPEIADLVDALNTNKLSTVASCSGHGHRPGRISLKDGRELLVMNSEQVATVERLFGTDINGASQESAPGQEVVAYGLPNTAITGKKQVLMQVRLDIPSNDQYGGALWVPLYLTPPTSTAIAAMVIKQAAEICREAATRFLLAAEGADIHSQEHTQLRMNAGVLDVAADEILALTPANAEAELEALMMKVADAAWGMYCRDSEWTHETVRAIVRRVLEEKVE